MKTVLLSSAALLAASVSAAPSANAVQYGGMNIAGFDFGCETDGNCNIGGAKPPLSSAGNADGVGQMAHFAHDNGMNIFRLPVSWQWLVNGQSASSPLDTNNLAKYDELVQGCLQTGAKCVIDIHNYARYNGLIIGQGGPSDDDFANLWTQLASKYAGASNVVFGIMNEPHDLDINTWANTIQKAVTAIRSAGAGSQMILLPGADYASAGAFQWNGSLDNLHRITNPDGSTDNLVFDIHAYLDSNNGGKTPECDKDHADDYASLASKLRGIGRKALLSETGGGNTESCKQFLCSEIAALASASDVYLGYIAWAAGSFWSNYELNMVPTNNGGSWSNPMIVDACVKRN